jgi:hypothetical protein
MERQRIMQKVLSRDNLAQMETLMYDEKLNWFCEVLLYMESKAQYYTYYEK